MYGVLVFALGFLTDHENETHQKCYSYYVIAFISVILINLTNQQVSIIFGWGALVLQSLFFGPNIKIIFLFAVFLVFISIFTNLFNYYGDSVTGQPFLKNLIPSSLAVISAYILCASHCSSHFAKVLRK